MDVDEIAAAVLQSPSVAAMSGRVETYLAGRRVAGVRIGDGTIEVHVVARWGAHLPTLASDVRQAVAAVPGASDAAVTVSIDDIEVP